MKKQREKSNFEKKEKKKEKRKILLLTNFHCLSCLFQAHEAIFFYKKWQERLFS
jgi:hypothetical protein